MNDEFRNVNRGGFRELHAGPLQPVTMAEVANSFFILPNDIQKEGSPEIHYHRPQGKSSILLAPPTVIMVQIREDNERGKAGDHEIRSSFHWFQAPTIKTDEGDLEHTTRYQETNDKRHLGQGS